MSNVKFRENDMEKVLDGTMMLAISLLITFVVILRIMVVFGRRKDEANANVEADETCRHEKWKVQGHNRIGWGTCLDCNREVNLCQLFNNLKARMEETGGSLA